LAPAALVELAAACGVGVLAVTDHDTLDGVAEAIAAGAVHGVRVVAGVELSVRAPSGSMHLLGYFDDPSPEPLASRLAELRERRRARAERMVRRLGELGAPIAFDDVARRAAGAIGRPHVADALVAAGHVADRQEAFDRYLCDGGPAWVPHDGMDPREAIGLVTGSGGAAALAHPGSLRMSPRELGAFVHRLAAWGLRGIEVHRPDHTPERRAQLTGIARRLGLVATGGSDFHRPGEALRPGDTGDPPLPIDAIDRLRSDIRGPDEEPMGGRSARAEGDPLAWPS
jgi:3',5'-nucleoside bisphosphate phosphatase